MKLTSSALLALFTLASTSFVHAEDLASLTKRVDDLSARVAALETKPSTAPYVCSAACVYWWPSGGYPNEIHTVYTSAADRIQGFEALNKKCAADYEASGYTSGRYYLKNPTTGHEALPNDGLTCTQ